jgi:hypothetical protein
MLIAAPAACADPGAGRRSYEHGAGRDVEGVRAVAAGVADDIDQVRLVGDAPCRELVSLARRGDFTDGFFTRRPVISCHHEATSAAHDEPRCSISS